MADGFPRPPLRLEIEAAAAVLAGAAWPVRLKLVNDGPQPVELPDAGPPSPLVFRFVEQGSPDLHGPWRVLERSAREARAIRIGDARMPPLQPRPRSVAAGGGALPFSDDPAGAHPDGLPPGRWRVFATCPLAGGRLLRSAGFDLLVMRPQVSSLAVLDCAASGRAVFAWAARERAAEPVPADAPGEPSPWTLLLRDGAGERTDLGAAVPVGAQAAPEAPQLALAAHEVPRLPGRWLAWQHGAGIDVVQAAGPNLTARPGGVRPTLDAPQLLPCGLHRAAPPAAAQAAPFDCGEGWFFLAGALRGGTGVQALRARRDALGAGPPQMLSLRPVQALRVRLAPGGAGPPALDFVWLDDDGLAARWMTRRIARWRLAPDGTGEEGAAPSAPGERQDRSAGDDATDEVDRPARVLAELAWPLAALALHPAPRAGLAPADPGEARGHLAWLEGPLRRPDGVERVRWRSVPVDPVADALPGTGAGGRTIEAALPRVPRGAAGDGNGGWRLALAAPGADGPGSGARVAAAWGARVWTADLAAPAPEWVLIHEASAPVGALHVSRSLGGAWSVVVADAVGGVTVKVDPDFSSER